MRCLVGSIFVVALGVMGCNETSPNMCEGVDCDDNNECTYDVCDPATGTCEHFGNCDCVDCNDDNECTDDACDLTTGMCTNRPFDDGTDCGDGAGTCQAGSCMGTFACTEQGIRDAIAIGGGPHTFACVGPTIVVTEAEIVIDKDVVLDGEGDLIVDGDEDHRVFSVPQGVTAKLRRFVVTNGSLPVNENGGGILNHGILTLTSTAVSKNSAYGGGGIANLDGATLTMTNCTVSGNTAVGAGGIWNEASRGSPNSTLTMINSTVSGNTAEYDGGLSSGQLGTVTMINCTVTGNTGTDGVGGIWNYVHATLTMINCTVTDNTTADRADIVNFNTLSVANSLIEGDCSSRQPIESTGHNIESPGDTCGFDPDGTDQVNVSADDLNLGELADNGGPTMTHKPGDGGFGDDSTAIDAIPGDACEVTEDQRGEPRPETGGTLCDVGAVEVQPAQ